jgi:hypothetical protein
MNKFEELILGNELKTLAIIFNEIATKSIV